MVASLGGDLVSFIVTHLTPVVQKVDSGIQQISLYQWLVQLVSLLLIHWILIYPVDTPIQGLNKWGQLEGDVRDHVTPRESESFLRQTAKVNLYRVTKFSLHLSFTVHYFLKNIRLSQWTSFILKNSFGQYLSAHFLF